MNMELSALQSFDGTVSSDIYPGVFDWLFENDAFQRWRQGNGHWQLHCIGGPGSGKTTASTLISRHLEEFFETERYPVISLRLEEDVLDYQTDLVEDFLEAVYQRLQASQAVATDKASRVYGKYRNERYATSAEGCRMRERLRLIRMAIHTALDDTDNLRAYLIFDGIDRCGSSLRYLLDSELADLQKRGMSILLTSRLAIFENEEATCDHNPLPPDMRKALSVYMQCKTCEDTVICFPCVKASKQCEICEDECDLYEPYEHADIRLSVSPEKMAEFIAWDLEREHGDLGLQSTAHKPPLSRLGESLILNSGSRPIETIIDDIVERSYGNMAIARARLDIIHDMDSLEGLESKKDQLPITVSALFDCGLQHIDALPARQRDIALKSIAAAGRSVSGYKIPDLRALLAFLGILGVRSGEEIVEAARGWLAVSTNKDPQRVLVYDTNFLYYVQQRYHQALHRSSIQIESHDQRRRAVYDAETAGLVNQARFEPQSVSETPATVTPYKLNRTVTTMPAIEEAPPQRFIIRKGTIAWN